MEILDIILIGVALSMDACAITIANCTTYKKTLTRTQEWSMPLFFAVFQGIMPLIGYFIGFLLSDLIVSISKFLTAGIFFLLTIKIIFDIIKEKKEQENCKEVCPVPNTNKLTLLVVCAQAIATSIDALAVGLTFVGMQTHVIIAVLLISLVTFVLVSLALLFGKKLGDLFGKYAEWIGAIILFILAVKALIEALI